MAGAQTEGGAVRGNNSRLAYERQRRGALLRKERISRARFLGGHTDADWIALCAEMGNRCVRCGVRASMLIGGKLTKDHIKPIYQGGCDCIHNLQPMCRNCNSAKGPDAFDWIAYRRLHGFQSR